MEASNFNQYSTTHILTFLHNQLRGDVEVKRRLDCILQRTKELFKNELGTMKGTRARIDVKEWVSPKFVKARPIPYALTDRVGREIEVSGGEDIGTSRGVRMGCASGTHC